MPAKNKNYRVIENRFDADFEEFMTSSENQRKMLEIQTKALAEISRLEHSPQSLISAKHIAQDALLASVQIYSNGGNQNAETKN